MSGQWSLSCFGIEEGGKGLFPKISGPWKETDTTTIEVRYGAFDLIKLWDKRTTLGKEFEERKGAPRQPLTTKFRQDLRGTYVNDDCGHVIPWKNFGSNGSSNNFIIQNSSINRSLGPTVDRHSVLEILHQYRDHGLRLEYIWIFKSPESPESPESPKSPKDMAIRPEMFLVMSRLEMGEERRRTKTLFGHLIYNPTFDEYAKAREVLDFLSCSDQPLPSFYQYKLGKMVNQASFERRFVTLSQNLRDNKSTLAKDTATRIINAVNSNDMFPADGEMDGYIDQWCRMLPDTRKIGSKVSREMFRIGEPIAALLLYFYEKITKEKILRTDQRENIEEIIKKCFYKNYQKGSYKSLNERYKSWKAKRRIEMTGGAALGGKLAALDENAESISAGVDMMLLDHLGVNN